MHTFWKPAALVILLVLAGSGQAAAADPALPIGLLNMDRVVKAHQPLQDKLTPVKEEAKKLDEDVQLRQAELETVVNKLRASRPGSPEFQKLQVQAAKLQADLQQFVNTERANLQKKEADVYLVFYRELDAVVGKYAKEHGIKLVMRQQDTSLDDNQSQQDILKLLNRNIIYEDGLDITDEILKALAARPVATPQP